MLFRVQGFMTIPCGPLPKPPHRPITVPSYTYIYIYMYMYMRGAFILWGFYWVQVQPGSYTDYEGLRVYGPGFRV